MFYSVKVGNILTTFLKVHETDTVNTLDKSSSKHTIIFSVF